MGGVQTNKEDIAAVTEVARAYYEGMMSGDEALLSRAFHPRACIVGNYQGELEWLTLEEFVAECKEGSGPAVGPSRWRLDGLLVEGDKALIRLGTQYAGEWYSDDLSMLHSSPVLTLPATSPEPTRLGCHLRAAQRHDQAEPVQEFPRRVVPGSGLHVRTAQGRQPHEGTPPRGGHLAL